MLTTYNSEFQNFLFSALPSNFPLVFKRFVEWTVGQTPDRDLWTAIDQLGLLDRYESMVASVCYEMIEQQVKETCVGKWDEQVLSGLRSWMTNRIVPWMIFPYARNARTREFDSLLFSCCLTARCSAEETRTSLQGIGSRFDFHVMKTLCDLR